MTSTRVPSPTPSNLLKPPQPRIKKTKSMAVSTMTLQIKTSQRSLKKTSKRRVTKMGRILLKSSLRSRNRERN
jgi:hypothetical protein